MSNTIPGTRRARALICVVPLIAAPAFADLTLESNLSRLRDIGYSNSQALHRHSTGTHGGNAIRASRHDALDLKWYALGATRFSWLTERFLAGVKLDVGPGDNTGTGNAFTFFDAALFTNNTFNRRWSADAEVRYVSVDETTATILRSGITWQGADWSAKPELQWSLGSSSTRTIGVRFGHLSYYKPFFGVVVGDIDPELSDVPGSVATSIRQAYAGFTITTGRYAWTTGLDAGRHGAVDRVALSIAITRRATP